MIGISCGCDRSGGGEYDTAVITLASTGLWNELLNCTATWLLLLLLLLQITAAVAHIGV